MPRYLLSGGSLIYLVKGNVPFRRSCASESAARVTCDSTTCRVPGFAVHEELARFVDAGLSPLQSLRTATLNLAQHLNMTDSVGTIATGTLADLVLLEGDPVTYICNTARIAAIVANGQLFDGTARRDLFDDVLASAAGTKPGTN